MTTIVSSAGSATQRAPATLFDKLWRDHEILSWGGGVSLLQVDRLLLHEVTGSVVMREMQQAGHRAASPSQVFSFIDHLLDTHPREGPRRGWNPAAIRMIDDARLASRTLGVHFVDADDPRQGIVHIAAAELGIALPGTTIVCGDSHTCTLGALGALAWGIGTSEGSHVLATQTLSQERPRTMRVRFDGTPSDGVGAKDLVLHLIGLVGAAGGGGYAIEYAGSAVERMSLEARMTLCNMAIELAARYGLVAPDDAVFSYLHGRAKAPTGAAWDAALRHWRTLRSDDGARFDRELSIDCAGIEPQVTWGTSPQQVASAGAVVPDPQSMPDADGRRWAERALQYQGLVPGTPLAQVPIDVAYIGSCTNARVSDLRDAARVLRGRRIADGVTGIVVPGSRAIKADAEAEGLDRVFRDAGFEWHEPGCGMCGSGKGRLADVRVVSTTNRNFENRQGARVRTHLASPATVAASAVTGRLADPRPLLAGR